MFKKIYIEVTNICNLNCKFCPETKRDKAFMSIDEFETIIKQIKTYTNLVCLHVKGEPLVHKNLNDIISILKKYDMNANITTNGLLINRYAEIFNNSKSIRQINFSLHSLTQNNNLDVKYLNNIFECANKMPNKIISYRLWNIQDIKENDVNDEILNELEKFYNINNLKDILKEKEFYKIKENVFINQDIQFTWPDINGKAIIEQGRCLALKDQIAILVDGTVVPCCMDNNGDIPLGNIFKEDFNEILNKDKTKEIKNNFLNNKITCDLCKTCGFLKNLEQKRI